MYHENTIINGVLHHRSVPEGQWVPYTAHELTQALLKLRETESAQELKALRQELLQISSELNRIRARIDTQLFPSRGFCTLEEVE